MRDRHRSWLLTPKRSEKSGHRPPLHRVRVAAGFSQGATAAALLLADLAQHAGSAPAPKFAILVRTPPRYCIGMGPDAFLLALDGRYLGLLCPLYNNNVFCSKCGHTCDLVQVSGFLPKDAASAAALTGARVSTPSLFIHGEADELVPLERCLELRQTFDPQSCSLLTHPGGHLVPSCAGAVKQQLVDFLSKY